MIAGKGVMARLEPEGQDDMNAEARVKTERTPRGVSKAEGMAADFVAVRMKVWWRDSTVTICAATVRMAGLFTKGAAPRYLSSMSAYPPFRREEEGIRRNTNILQNTRSRDHRLGRRKTKFIITSLNRLRPRAINRTGQSCDVYGFGASDGLQICDVVGGKAGGEEFFFGEFGETLLVEGSFEVFGCQGTLSMLGGVKMGGERRVYNWRISTSVRFEDGAASVDWRRERS